MSGARTVARRHTQAEACVKHRDDHSARTHGRCGVGPLSIVGSSQMPPRMRRATSSKTTNVRARAVSAGRRIAVLGLSRVFVEVSAGHEQDSCESGDSRPRGERGSGSSKVTIVDSKSFGRLFHGIESQMRVAFHVSGARVFWPQQFVRAGSDIEDILRAFKKLRDEGRVNIVVDLLCADGHRLRTVRPEELEHELEFLEHCSKC